MEKFDNDEKQISESDRNDKNDSEKEIIDFTKFSEYQTYINSTKRDKIEIKSFINSLNYYKNSLNNIFALDYIDENGLEVSDRRLDVEMLAMEFNFAKYSYSDFLNGYDGNREIVFFDRKFILFGNETYKALLKYLKYNKSKEQWKWFVSDEFEEQMYLIDAIILDLQNILIGNQRQESVIPDNDFDITDSPEKIKLKGEMIILKEFGVIDNFNKIQSLTNAETAKRIKIILSEKIKMAEIKNPQKYIENILVAIASGKPDIKSDKTPYKKQNIKYALTELTKNGLSIEDTIYLKDLKQTNSNLFD